MIGAAVGTGTGATVVEVVVDVARGRAAGRVVVVDGLEVVVESAAGAAGSCGAELPGPAGGVGGGVDVVDGEPYTGPPLPPSVVTVVGAAGAVGDGARVCAFGSVACCGAAPAGPATSAATVIAPNSVAASVAMSRRMGSLGRAGRWGRVAAGMAMLVALAACSDDAGPGVAAAPQGSPAAGATTERSTSEATGARSTAAPGGGDGPTTGAGGSTGGSAATGTAAAAPCPAGPSREISAAGGPPTFADATDALGLTAPLTGMMGHAAAVADVDGDGWVDLFVGTFADRPAAEYALRGAAGPSPDRLLLGGPAGFHVDDTFAGTPGRTTAAAFADLDGDGDPDLVVARNFRRGEVGSAPSLVFRDDGGHLVAAGELPTDTMSARAVVPVDLDGDGHLDLVVLADRFGSDETSRIFKGDGRLGFTDATAAFGLPADVVGLGAAAADLTGDGWPDLVVVGEAGRNRLFVNDGAGHLREDASAELDWPIYGKEDDTSGVAVADLDRDGRLDLVIGHHYTSTLDFGKRVPVRVYRNERTDADGMPVLQDVTDQTGIPGFATKAPQVEIADFDADGWPDILVGASAGGGRRRGSCATSACRAACRASSRPPGSAIRSTGSPVPPSTPTTTAASTCSWSSSTPPSRRRSGGAPARPATGSTSPAPRSAASCRSTRPAAWASRAACSAPARSWPTPATARDRSPTPGSAWAAPRRLTSASCARSALRPSTFPGWRRDRAATATGAPSCPGATARPS